MAQISFRLDEDKPEEKKLIEYLNGKPKKWIITQAMRLYMDAETGQVAKPLPPQQQAQHDELKDFDL